MSSLIIRRVKQVGPVVAVAVLLFTNINQRKLKSLTTFQSLVYTVRSSTLRNLLLSAGFVAACSKFLFGAKAQRTFPVFFFTIWGLTYQYRVVETPKVSYQRTYWNTHIVEKAQITKTAFHPVFWAFNRHAQTITCYLVSAIEWLWSDPIVYTRQEIPTYDGVNVQFLDEARFSDDSDNSDPNQITHPIIFCIHGLGDHRDIPYIKRFARMCLRAGWRVVVWSYWRFDFEESRDLHLAIEHLQRSNPGAPIVAVGWSAGSYLLTRYLQKIGSDTPLICAVCQSPCLDFVEAVRNVSENENKSYPLFLLGQSIIGMRRHIEQDQMIKDSVKAKLHKLVRSEANPMKLYNKFLCALPRDRTVDRSGLGHEGKISVGKTVEERVKTCSHYMAKSCDNFHRVQVATLLLHAEDDPVVSYDHVNWEKIKSNRHVIIGHTKRGGHCAWHEGLFPFGDTWGDKITTQFVSTILESHSQTHFIIDLVRAAMANQSMNREAMVNQDGKIPKLSPQTMARIVSASDLRSMAK